MLHSSRRFVAVILLLWLPLFSASALAATISMQTQQGRCHETATSHTMAHSHMGAHHQHHSEMAPATDEHSPSCNGCGVCHLACTGFLAEPGIALAAAETPVRENTPYLVAFDSFSSVPLVPPPLARA